MRHHQNHRKKGFTLVELSIVLVIIGLLIGGILAAQSMITTSKVQALTQELGQFDAATENFKTKYNYLPGDAPAFGGDGDGLITDICCGKHTALFSTTGATTEVAAFWNNIDSQQFPGSAGLGPAISSGPGKNVPLSKLGKSGSFFIADAWAGAGQTGADVTNPRNYYVLLDPTQFQVLDYGVYYLLTPVSSANSAVKPVDLLALDQKIDDGNGLTGNVLAGGLNSYITTLPTCTDNDGTYALTNSGYECTPLIRIGASVNDPQ